MKLTFDVPEGLAEKIAENIKVALEEKKKRQIWPQKGDDYYFIFSDGQIACNRYGDFPIDRNRLKIDNMFKTEEEAKFKREQLKVMHELEQLADDDQPWVQGCHYYLTYSYSHKAINTEYTISAKTSVCYFKSPESCQAAIDKIGKDRLKKYYFCIPEEE